ncbi:CBD9-like protein [Guyanagaster necrorhizus]|uniref:CBD9-like protein n=1 Tax=Guyanagaster necrorhizus TaxID=856835 RepID=A0A9P7W4P1_9AGAR|nr:CBD9-like protein [Guyanagaster necrorhizus MCA 3950]KAG7451905.1 CBD9-like protein [Guyanagaster necrorhizus MCA 3950]
MFSRRTFVTSVAVLLGIRGAAGQSASAYTDPTTGMTFQALQDSSTGFVLGIALPETIGTDFIGQMVFALTDGAGWGGASFNGAMTESLLLVAWPNGDEVMASFREATEYSTPPVYNGSDVTLSTVADGTYINDTHLSLTFLCGGCIVGDDLTFSSNDTSAVLGWAYSTSSPSDVTDESTDLVYHSAGYGEFGLGIADAQTSEYETWAALAVGDDSGSSSSAVSSTPVPVSSVTAAATSTIVASSSTRSAASDASSSATSEATITTTKVASTTLASVGTTTTSADSSTITDANVCMNSMFMLSFPIFPTCLTNRN